MCKIKVKKNIYNDKIWKCNIKGIEHDYGIRLHLKLMLKKLKIIGGPTLFVFLWGFSSKKLP